MKHSEAFANFFKANKNMWDAYFGLNKATNNIIGLHIISNVTGITYEVVNCFEYGNFKTRNFKILLKDITSPPLKFWSFQRWNYGWKQPHKFIPIEALEELINDGSVKIDENTFTRIKNNESEK
jgi:hypothetical protein